MPKERERTQPNAADTRRDEKNDTERQRGDSAHSANKGRRDENRPPRKIGKAH
jgi:hypothetical protein